jgi:hypothetical protein
MNIPPPIDPRALAAEVELTVAEFNRLAAFSATLGVQVLAELRTQAESNGVDRPILSVQVFAP